MKYFLLALLIPLVSFAQELDYNNGVFTKVFQTEKSNEEVYQNAREWIAINFKSANDVLQLDTKEKLIVKGTMRFSIYTGNYVFENIGQLMLTISIRDGRYKVDYEITQTQSVDYPDNTSTFTNLAFVTYANLSESEVLERKIKSFQEVARKEGWKEKKINKTIDDIKKNNPDKYKLNLITKNEFDSKVESTFYSLSSYINSTEKNEDW